MGPEAKYAWLDGELVPFERAQVHLLTHALHYGTAVFDSMRAYPTTAGPAIFRNGDHVRRLLESGRLYKMECGHDAAELERAARELLAANGFADGCYLRPLMFRGAGAMGVSPLGAPVRVGIAAWEWGAYLGPGAMEQGIRARISSWRRISGDSLLPASKAAAHYLNSVVAKLEAQEGGFDEAILLDGEGFISEGTGENVFVVRDGRLVTPPCSSAILAGVTRRTVLELAPELGIEVEERRVSRSEVYLADELFLTGTAAEVTPVRELDGYAIGSGARGPLTARVQEAFDAVVHGRDERHRDWLDVVDMSAAG